MNYHILKRVASLAVCYSIMAACNNDTTDIVENPTGQRVRITADAAFDDTRVNVGAYNGETFPLTWDENDAIAVINAATSHVEGSDIVQFPLTLGAGTNKARFEGEIETGDADYFAVYPYSALLQYTQSQSQFCIAIPNEQVPTTESTVDPAAVIMVSDGAKIVGNRLDLKFNHVTAYAKLKLKNLKDGVISNVVFSTQSSDLAGTYLYNAGNHGSSVCSSSYRSIKVDAANIKSCDDGSHEIMFALLPCALTDFKVEVNYDSAEAMVRNCTCEYPIEFKAGVVSGFTVNMAKPDVEEIFELSENTTEVSDDGGEVEVTVTSNYSYFISTLLPSWITQTASEKIDDLRTTYRFRVDANPGTEPRETAIVFCNENNVCIALLVKQAALQEDEVLDWTQREFFHRSLMMRFTATWCGYCPQMGHGVDIATGLAPDKIEAVAIHGPSSQLASPQSSVLESQFKIGGYPGGVVDYRAEIKNYSNYAYTATTIINAMKETEANYTAVTGIALTSSLNERTLNVEGTVYVKKADTYNITVMLLESGIVKAQTDYSVPSYNNATYVHNNLLRMTVSNIQGDSFKVESDNSEYKFNYTATVPAAYNLDNMRILVFIQRPFGTQNRIQSKEYGNYYVDNAVSARIGETHVLQLVESSKGGNESIVPGEDIEM